MNKLYRHFWLLVSQSIFKKYFGEMGKGSIVYSPLQIDGAKAISIGDNVSIAANSWLMGNEKADVESLIISDGVGIGHYAHIIALSRVIIENKVLTADRVYITDCTHNYEDINLAVIDQGIKVLKPVIIGAGSWIGENVCISGASIGRHCIIGANSVVIQDIPDYCVAVGAPARIIKRYDFDSKQWIKV